MASPGPESPPTLPRPFSTPARRPLGLGPRAGDTNDQRTNQTRPVGGMRTTGSKSGKPTAEC